MADPGTLFTDKRQALIESRLRKVYGDAQKTLKRRLKEHTDKYKAKDKIKRQQVKDGTLTQGAYESWVQGQVFIGQQWKDKIESVNDIIRRANQTATDIVNGERRAVFGENVTYQAYQLEHDAGMNLSFNVYDSAAVTRLINERPELMKRRKIDGVEQRAWNKALISDTIAKAIITGESIDRIADEIAEKTALSNAKASVRYARTSMTAAQNAGRISMLHEAHDMGIKVKKQWLATLDSRTRDSHASIDGEVKEIDEEFSNGLQYPGDPNGSAAEVWNCRCTLIYKYEQYPMQNAQRYDQENGELIENMTYKEWKAWKQSTSVSDIVSRAIAQGKDITATWARRADKFDFEIEDVMNAQGFDGLPRIVDPDEFDRLVKEANGGQGFIAQRTYSAPDQETLDAYREMLYNGKWYVDCSTGGAQYGQGMYCAADYTGKLSDGIKEEMEHYIELGRSRYTPSAEETLRISRLKSEAEEKAYNQTIEREISHFTKEQKAVVYRLQGIEDEDIRAIARNYRRENPDDYYDIIDNQYRRIIERATDERNKVMRMSFEEFAEKNGIPYGARNYVETFTLDPSAKIIKYSDARSEVIVSHAKSEYKLTNKEADKIKFVSRKRGSDFREAMAQLKSENPKLYRAYLDSRDWLNGIIDDDSFDIGSEIAKLGYDAINAEGHGESGSYTVILNRTKCIIRRP